MQIKPERRGSPRAGFNTEVTARFKGDTIECDAANLSENGMLLFPRRARVMLGQQIRLTFRLPRLSGSLTVEASVKRCEFVDGNIGWGVRFNRVAPRVRRMIRTYVFVGHGAVRDYDEHAALR